MQAPWGFAKDPRKKIRAYRRRHLRATHLALLAERAEEAKLRKSEDRRLGRGARKVEAALVGCRDI